MAAQFPFSTKRFNPIPSLVWVPNVRLVMPSQHRYGRSMIVRVVAIGIVTMGFGLGKIAAETVVLRDNASVTGRILTQKRDFLVVDLGFTVVSIPRSAVLRVADEPGPAVATGHRNKGAKTNVAAAPKPLPPADAGDEPELFRVTRGNNPERTVRELVSQLGEAVVQVRTPGGLGSGFFINEEGYLITNFHVIESESQIGVDVYRQQNGQLERKVFKQVRIIAMNKFQDLTLLKVEDKDAPKFSYVPLGDSDQLAVGERVFAVGSPLGLERTVTEGIVSTKTRQFQGGLYIQTTAQINPGNSGGPLFNLRGEVTGVTNMKIFGEGIGFAIPIEHVKYFLRHRDAYAYDTDNPSNPYRYLEPPSRLKHAVDTGSDSAAK
jgi:serine protease Do